MSGRAGTGPGIIQDVVQLVKNLAFDIGKRVTGTITSARNLGDVIDNLGSILRGPPDALRGARPDGQHVPEGRDVDTYGLNPDGTPMTYANGSRPGSGWTPSRTCGPTGRPRCFPTGRRSPST